MQIYISLLLAALTSTILAAAPPEDDLLAGPEIVEEEVTDQDLLARRLQETGKVPNITSRQQIKIWRTTLMSLDLTPDQSRQMSELKDEFEVSQQAFQKEYGKEMKSIRKEQSAAKKNDTLPSEESRNRMMELMELSPDVSEFQRKAWSLLTTDQQSVFQLKFQERIEEEQKRKAEKQSKDTPMGEMKEQEGFSPRDSKFRNRDIDIENDSIERPKDAVDKDTLRRIKFLRRLQELEQD